jgi:hypothetical protein
MNTLLEIPVRESVATGLCTTCEHAPHCTHPRAYGVPVLECGDMAPLVLAVAPVTGIDAARSVPQRARTDAKGLCTTCVRLAGCTYPKLEGGVWHCDEFEWEVAP